MEFVIRTHQRGAASAPPSPRLPLPPAGLPAWETESSGKSELGTGRGHGPSLFLLLHGNKSNSRTSKEVYIIHRRTGDLLPSPLQAASICFLQVFFLPVPFIFVTFFSSFGLLKLCFWSLFSATQNCMLREMYESIVSCSARKKGSRCQSQYIKSAQKF